MAVVTASKDSVSVKAYIGDSKTMPAFNFTSAAAAKNLAGFSIHSQPPGGATQTSIMTVEATSGSLVHSSQINWSRGSSRN